MVVKLSDFLNTSFSTYTENDAFNTSVVYPITLTHTTTATPGAGIGTGLKFITETSAGNNEIGGLIDVVTTDVTSTSEDFAFVFKTMAGGNAATESLRIGSTGDLTTAGDLVVNGGQVTLTATSTRDKYRVWTSSDYAIGMQNSVTFGAINNDYAMTFQMSDTANRGFWWGDTTHTVAQGAMALSTDGKLSVAHSLRLGYGESDTTTPGIDFVLDVNGGINATNVDFGNVDIGVTTGFDSWKYDGNSFSFSAQTTDPGGIFVDSSGNRAYIVAADSSLVYRYSFTTANKIDTLSNTFDDLDISAKDTQLISVFLKPNGLELYVTGLDNSSIYQYTLSTAWLLASATYTRTLSVSAVDTIPVGLFFKSDGTKMYLVGQQNADVYQYNLSTAWNISTATYLQTLSLATSAKTPTAITFSDDGSILYITDSKYDSIVKFTLSTAWDISSAVYTDKLDIGDAGGTSLTNPVGIALSETANRLFIICASNNKAFELDLTSPSVRVTGNRFIVNNDVHIKNDLVVYQDARIQKNVEITGTTILHDSLSVTGTITTSATDTATAATHYYVEIASDGVIRPKTLANVRTEIVTTAAVNAAAATTVGIITSGEWQGTVIEGQYGGTGVANTGKTITLGGSFTHTGAHTLGVTTTANTSITLPTTGTLATTSNKLSVFASTSSSELAGVISDETGSGVLVFGTAPTFTTTIDGGATFGAFASSTALTFGYTGVAASTTNISTGAVASATTKTINLGTGGAAGSTTNINIGDADGGTTAIASPTVTVAGVADTATAATHYYVEIATDGTVRPKTLANVKTEIVTTAAVNSAAATTVGTITSGTWNGSVISATYGGTGLSSLGTGVATWLGTPSSANLLSAITDETGSGALVFGTAPTFTTSIDGGATFGAFASSTSLTLGYTSTAASTTNISTGAVAASTTKTINLGTGGAASSTTNINIGDADGGTTAIASPTVTVAGVADTATAATHYYVEIATDGTVRPKTLANVKTEIVTTAAVNSAAATTVGTITSGTWQGTVIDPTYGGTGVNNATRTITLNTGNLTLTADAAGSSVTVPATGTLATTSNKLSAFAATTSSELAGVISDETGSGALVFASSPTLTTPTLGVASATSINKVTLTAPATGSTLTIADGKTLTASNTLTFTGTDGISAAFGGGGTVAYTGSTLAQFAATTSLQLLGVISDETGSGSLVFATSPTLTTPTLGVASATSINKVTLTAPATGSTLTIADGKTLTASNTLTFTGTDGISAAFGGGGTVAYTGSTLAQFAATTSLQLLGVISDETGSGSLVFGTAPTFTTTIDGGATFGAFASSTALTLGYTSTAASTTNISTGAVASATTKTINLGTGGAAGSTTNINIGSASGGTTTVNNNLTVTGTLTVNGTTTTVNSTTVTVDDPIFTIGGDTAPASDDNKDRGIEFRWHNGTAAKLGFFGFDDSTGYFTFIPDATNTSEVFSGTTGTLDIAGITGSGAVAIVSAAASTLALTSGTTGAITLDSGTTGAVNVGTGSSAKTITIGNGTGATSLVLNAGTGAINIGTNAFARTITIGNATGASALTLDSGTGAINIGTSIAKTVTVGNTTGATAVVVNSGTGGISLNSIKWPTVDGSIGQALVTNGAGQLNFQNVSGGGIVASSYIAIGILSADQTVTSGADTLINFVDYDDAQSWWNPTTKRFTPTIAGYYDVTLSAWWVAGVISNNQTNLQIRKNGNSYALSQEIINTSTGQSPNLNRTIYLNGTTDYLDFTVFTSNTTSQVLQKGTVDGSGTFFSAALITSGGLTGNIVEDTTPQLGGDLDVNGKVIVSATGSNGNILITPDGTGYIQLDGLKWPTADGSNGYLLQTNGAGQLAWTAAGSNTTYTQSAVTTTGGALLRLTGSDASTDDVKFADGTSITVAFTDANTITVNHADTSTLTGAQGSAGIAAFTLDGLGHVTAVTTATYLTAEADTLATVTGRGATTSTASSFTGGAVVALEDSGTNTVLHPLDIRRTSSGTPAAGIGVGMEFIVETTASNNETGAMIEAVTTDITATSEDFDLVFRTMSAGAAPAQRLTLTSTGALQLWNSASTFYHSVTSPATANRTITLPDGNVTLQAGTMALTSGTLAQFAATTSSQLLGVISDETGSGVLVFGTAPTFTTTIDGGATFGAFASSTALTLGYTGTAASTTNISTGATATATTKTINLGTGGAAGSTTNINIGSSVAGTTTISSPNITISGLVDTATTATHYYVETTAGNILPKTLANARTEIVTTAAVNAAAATTTGTVTTGTWSGLFGAVSGANLTSLTAGNLSGTIPSGVLGNSALFIGTTSIALNRASLAQSLTGINIDGSAGSCTGNAGTVTNGVYTTGNQSIAGIKTFSNGTASTTNTTGSVVITGGLGVSGAINAGADVTAYATSDSRLKANIENIPDALAKVNQLNGVTYNWNELAHEVEHKDTNVREVGVLAQQVNDVLPEVINVRDNGYMAVRYEKMVPLLIEAIKELTEQNRQLAQRLSDLEDNN
jgi:hypothetical protein